MLAGWLPLLRIINIANQQIILLYLATKVAQSKMDSITEQTEKSEDENDLWKKLTDFAG